MLITRTSILTGITRTKDLPVVQEQFERWIAGVLIQDAFSNLSADDREFIKTGISGDEWETLSDEDDV